MSLRSVALILVVVIGLSIGALYAPVPPTQTKVHADHHQRPLHHAKPLETTATTSSGRIASAYNSQRLSSPLKKLLPSIGPDAVKMFAEPPPSPPSLDGRHASAASAQQLLPPPTVSQPPPPPSPLPSPAPSPVASSTSPRARCESLQQRHNVVVGASWGSLSVKEQALWTSLECDAHIRGDKTAAAATAATAAATSPSSSSDDAWTREYKQHLRDSLANRPASRRLSRPHYGGGRRPLVLAVCACTTSRGLRFSRLDQFLLFNLMLPSLLSTLRNKPTLNDTLVGVGGSEPFELWVYIAFDTGDSFYDRPAREAEVRSWLDANLVEPMAAHGVRVKHALLKFENKYRKPGPAFNYMMAAASEDGADYLYRINDDTQFSTVWLPEAVRTLRSYAPPNVGVVGPVCHEGNTRILTHDLVHRTHLEIFHGLYYPPILSDWWMDDWITHVYGPSRTTKGPWLVKHLWTVHGTRYTVDHAHERRLSTELDAGRQRIEAWLGGRH